MSRFQNVLLENEYSLRLFPIDTDLAFGGLKVAKRAL